MAEGGLVAYFAWKAFSAAKDSWKSGKRSGYSAGLASESATAWLTWARSPFHALTTSARPLGQYVLAKNAASGRRLAFTSTSRALLQSLRRRKQRTAMLAMPLSEANFAVAASSTPSPAAVATRKSALRSLASRKQRLARLKSPCSSATSPSCFHLLRGGMAWFGCLLMLTMMSAAICNLPSWVASSNLCSSSLEICNASAG
mmetsp:Transcript_156200/g.501131  ORF Transcript_156200/g.501131 Transcript_156200/m.501131 type:complete len:202 (+) Transcript_156200:529-1134(+)